MAHPENTTTPSPEQLPLLRPMDFGSHELEGDAVFSIKAHVGLMEGIGLAVGLPEGIHQLAHRLELAANMGETIRTNELRALAFLADAANTLNRSAQVALEKWEVQP
ncbi:Uncharacterised protein [Pseudomonas putida]|uniref:hypothetical protein n=1 Tax=Pseudomonas asiatica TaxID=2219225 RepID=UPI00142EC4E7|nr:hypothetical protein [Pseudomonas asiatica]CAB5637125.1 Uncharacterised protein [Pseudomonas putida]MBO2923289.1 hypothetical protein [Pseudomonas asiatica]WPU60241.1 hypothetical protein SQW15_26715 [Pseudomonas asiatica]CAB5683686.1 Uncharacterised protein [Pseudomonas putida]CAB5712721.1 Uncharacterised protein [Pseudomonas putida]